LVSQVLSPETVREIIDNAELVSYKNTGCGYFLDIRHPDLPEERMVCHKPIVIGEADGFTSGFVVFIENGGLTIECHEWGGEPNMPEDFRDKDVHVRPVKVEDGKFIAIYE